MSTTTLSPRTLAAWLQVLDRVHLPVPAGQHLLLRHALGNDRQSLGEIVELIQDSPTVALNLLREANRQVDGLREPAQSLEVALKRLGLKQAEQLLNRLPAIEPVAIGRELRQLQLISLHASQQAHGLFGARLAQRWQEIHWGSLLFLAPLWPLAASHPELFAAWEQRVLAQGEAPTQVEQQLFGVPLIKLCLALAEHWRLPDWIIQGYRLLDGDQRLLVKALRIARDNQHPLLQQQRLDADVPLRHWLTQPSNTVLLANGLAMSAHQAWNSPHSLRWQRLTGLYLQLPLDQVQQQVHQQAAQSARQHAGGDLWHPAHALLWPWEARHLPANPAVAPLAAPDRLTCNATPDATALGATPSPEPIAGPLSGTAPAPTASAQDIWRNQCAELLHEPSDFATLQHLTACARDALHACGLSRVLLLLSDPSHTHLQAQQVLGLPPETANLTLDPSQSPVLRHLLKQPSQLRLTPTNSAKISALLPAALSTLFPSQHLLLCSLASQGQVRLLLIADRGGAPLSTVNLQAWAKTLQCIERALPSFAKRGH